MTRISICVITCNQREMIEQCLMSILDQEVSADVRVLVGDDASDDGTSDVVSRIAKQSGGRVVLYRRSDRAGAMANMRALMELADGDFVARVDGDDYWLPGKLQRQLDYLQSSPECFAVYSNAVTVDQSGRVTGLFNDVGDAKFDLRSMLTRGNFLHNSSMLVRKEGRRAWTDVRVPQIDYRVHLWHARHGLLGHIGTPLAAYRVNSSGSLMVTRSSFVRDKYWEAILSVRDCVTEDDFAHAIADFLRRVFVRSLISRDFRLLRAWTDRVFVESPYGIARTTLLACASLSRVTGKAALRKTGIGRSGRVLHYR